MADDKKKKKFMELLLKGKGAVDPSAESDNYTIRSPSPSLNFTFGNDHGLPGGYTMMLYGPPRGGKSIISNAFAGQLHKDDPDAWVVKYNTEMREKKQVGKNQLKLYGIDPARYIAYERNDPEIFDHIEQNLHAMYQDGMKLKLVIIDSTSMIQGRRGMNADTIMTQQIGDNASTIQEGLKRILGVQREIGFGLILCTHIRAQFERGTSATVHTSRTTAVKPQGGLAQGHYAEYYMYVEPDNRSESKADLLGNKFEDASVKDFDDNAEKLGHKVKMRMVDASFGPKNRHGAFTFDYNKGIINTHEEVFLLGVNRGLIERPNNTKYCFGDKEWNGKPAMLNALKEDASLCETIITELRRRDIAGEYSSTGEESPEVEE